jgi:hypothetical protein
MMLRLSTKTLTDMPATANIAPACKSSLQYATHAAAHSGRIHEQQRCCQPWRKVQHDGEQTAAQTQSTASVMQRVVHSNAVTTLSRLENRKYFLKLAGLSACNQRFTGATTIMCYIVCTFLSNTGTKRCLVPLKTAAPAISQQVNTSLQSPPNHTSTSTSQRRQDTNTATLGCRFCCFKEHGASSSSTTNRPLVCCASQPATTVPCWRASNPDPAGVLNAVCFIFTGHHSAKQRCPPQAGLSAEHASQHGYPKRTPMHTL